VFGYAAVAQTISAVAATGNVLRYTAMVVMAVATQLALPNG